MLVNMRRQKDGIAYVQFLLAVSTSTPVDNSRAALQRPIKDVENEAPNHKAILT